MVRSYFSELDIMEMTDEEVELYFYVDKLNIKYIMNQVKNASAAKFKREDPKAYILLTEHTDKTKFKYQVTFFYNKKPISHKDCKNLKEAVNQIYDYIPSKTEYLTNFKKI